MRIVGHGIDIVAVDRIQRIVSGIGTSEVPADWFTSKELSHGSVDDPHNATHFAGQIAAKEAIVKAMGTGLIGNMTWPEIEVLREESGAPRVTLSGAVWEIAAARGIGAWFVSISHCDEYAVASAIAVEG